MSANVPAKKPKPPVEEDGESVPFETSLSELQQIVSQLEDGSLPLEESMQQFERGVHLLRNCYQVLESAEHRIEILTGTDRDGTVRTEPFDATATFDENTAQTDADDPPSDSLF